MDYDHNGNQLTTTVTLYVNGVQGTPLVTVTNTYDDLNQLISATTNGNSVTNGYNGEGLRVEKTVNGAITRYLYEYDKVILEVDGTGNQIAKNVYGTNLLARTVDGQTLYYMYNGHADVTALLNSVTGNVSATYYYDAFGNIQEQTGSVNNNITYAGYQYDKETGLYYLNARMYDPITARFMQEDTYRGDLNDPLSLNLYTYVANNPIKYDDPSGHVLNLVAAGIGAVLGATINTGITTVTDYLDDGEFNKGWKDYAGAAVSGAIGGAAAGFTLGGSLVATVAADAAAGIALSAVGNAFEQGIIKGKVNAEEVGWSALSGGLGGGLGRAFGNGVSKVINKVVDVPVPQTSSDAIRSIGRTANVTDDMAHSAGRSLVRWLFLLEGNENEEIRQKLEVLAMEDLMIDRAMKDWEVASADP